MVEKAIPWWRKALSYAMSGIRSLLGGGRSDPGVDNAISDERDEGSKIELAVKVVSPPIEVVPDETPEVERASTVPEVVAEETEPEAALAAERAPEMSAEIRAILKAVDEVEAETVVAPAVLAVTATDYDAISALEKIELAVEKLKPEAMEVEAEMAPPAKTGETPPVEETEAQPENAAVETLTAVPDAEIPVVLEEQSVAGTEVAGSEIAPAVEELAAVETEPAETEAMPVVEEVSATGIDIAEAENVPAVEEQVLAVAEQASAKTEVDESAGAPAVEEQTVVESEAPAARETVEEAIEEEESAPAEAETQAEAIPALMDEVSPQAAAAIPSAPANSDSEARPSAEPAPVAVKSEAEQKTAARIAAAVKAREESADPSPFSIFLGQVYEGPLDLLLDLIRKQDIDIYDIPIAKITAQFLAYVNQLKASDMDVAGEFIYTASLLIHIKSKMLLPRTSLGPEDAAEDPRRELVERLLEHERFKNAAQMLQQKQMLEAATWTNPGVREFREDAGAEPEIAADTTDLVRVFREILDRARSRPIINVEEDAVTVGQMIQFLARRLTMEDRPVALHKLLSHTRSERALIAMFLALLELVRLQAILLRQDRHFSEIFIKKHTGFEAVMDQGLASARDDWR